MIFIPCLNRVNVMYMLADDLKSHNKILLNVQNGKYKWVMAGGE